jgi:hypothetical protein
VFLIVLSDQGYNQTFNQASPDTYLAKTLVKQGELIPQYFAVGQGELTNGIALISGQGSTVETASNCPTFTDISPYTIGSSRQVLGSGCVYPAQLKTLGDQLTAAHDTWKAYVQGLASGPAGDPNACRHPTLGSADPYSAPRAGDPYVTWLNPFVYFHSLIDKPSCAKHDVDLSKLAADLKNARKTPSLSYIVPSPCDNGGDLPCTPGAPSGLVEADKFLRKVVPEIEHSPAYKSDGLILITANQAPQTGANADASSCCNQPTFPNLPAQTTTSTTSTTDTTTTSTATTTTSTTPASTGGGPVGGGQVGLLLISKYVAPGVNASDNFNHFSLLRSIEDLFGLHHLGYAAAATLPAFNRTVYTNYSG